MNKFSLFIVNGVDPQKAMRDLDKLSGVCAETKGVDIYNFVVKIKDTRHIILVVETGDEK